jgi:hypothetical protein
MLELLQQWIGMSEQVEEKEQEVVDLKEEMSSVAGQLRALAGTSFEHQGKFYQVRTRGGKAYVCVFTTRPAGRRKAKTQE